MKLRGAISGFGAVGSRAHLAGWRTRPEVRIEVIHDPVAARRHEAINVIRGVRVYDDLELMLDGERPDFVDLASPPAFHAAAAIAALEAGAHVLVEKPMTLEREELAAVTDAARANSRVLMCVHNWKFAPAYARARELIDTGRLGEIRALTIERLRTEPAGAQSGERWRTEANGGGILIDHGWHVFYLMRWLMDEAPLAISAALRTPPGAAIEHEAELVVRFSRDRRARANLSWCASARRTTARIEGSRAILEIDGDRVVLTERGGDVHDLSVHDAPDDSYHAGWFAEMARSFEDAIAAGLDSAAARENLAEARTALQLILAARESSKMGGREIAVDI